MAALHFPVAQQQNVNIAGFTGANDVPTARPVSAAEHFAATVRTEAGSLGYLFGHSPLDAVATPLERATAAVRGSVGGLVPSHDTNTQITPDPGYSGTMAAPITDANADPVSTVLHKLRKVVGI